MAKSVSCGRLIAESLPRNCRRELPCSRTRPLPGVSTHLIGPYRGTKASPIASVRAVSEGLSQRQSSRWDPMRPLSQPWRYRSISPRFRPASLTPGISKSSGEAELPLGLFCGVYKASFLIVFYILCKLNCLVCFDLDNFICKWLYWFTILVLCDLAPFPLFIALQVVIADLVKQQLF